jgi:WD40 repeat protein
MKPSLTSVSRTHLAARLQRASAKSKLAAHVLERALPERLHKDDFDSVMKGFSGEVSQAERSVLARVGETLKAPQLWDSVKELMRSLPVSPRRSGDQKPFAVDLHATTSGKLAFNRGRDELYQMTQWGKLTGIKRSTGEQLFQEPVGPAAFAAYQNPAVSPDGKTVFHSCTGQGFSRCVTAFDLETRTVKWTTRSGPGALTNTPHVSAPVLTPDGSQLILAGADLQSINGYDPETGSLNWSVVLQNRAALGHSDPVVSADGSKIAFAYLDENNLRRLLMVDGQTHGLKFDIALGGSGTSCQPAFSPDGTRIYAGASGTFGAYDALTGDVQWSRSMSTPSDIEVAVSPDGSKLAMEGQQCVKLLSADDGTELLKVPYEKSIQQHPAFTADGSAVVMQEQTGWLSRINVADLSVDKLGSEMRASKRLESGKGFELSDDGQWAFVTEGAGVRAVRLDVV